MRVIELDAAGWTKVLDFYDAVLEALGAPAGHGKSIDALVDSVVWGGINAVEPPYTIRIRHVAGAPKDVTEEIELARQIIAKHRLHYQAQHRHDVDVQLEIVP